MNQLCKLLTFSSFVQTKRHAPFQEWTVAVSVFVKFEHTFIYFFRAMGQCQPNWCSSIFLRLSIAFFLLLTNIYMLLWRLCNFCVFLCNMSYWFIFYKEDTPVSHRLAEVSMFINSNFLGLKSLLFAILHCHQWMVQVRFSA